MKKEMIIIKGDPIPQKRHRFARGFSYDPSAKDKKIVKMQIKSQMKKKVIHNGPVSMWVTFFMKRPKSHYRTGKFKNMLKKNRAMNHTKRPDVDNLLKFIMDCCNDIVYKDDSQVFNCHIDKKYAEEPRTVLMIYKHKQKGE